MICDWTGAATALALLLGTGGAPGASGASPPISAAALDVRAFHPVEGPNSGPAVYYRVVSGSEGAILRGSYRPGLESVTMGVEVPEPLRQRARGLRWSWRARTFPDHGNECRPDLGDSAASVFATFKRGPKWYILKYVWSPEAPRGAVCDRRRGVLLWRDTVVLETDGATGTWRREEVDLRRAFIDHFGKGNPETKVPDLVGVGVMTDGDQTHSESAADWRDFEVLY